MAKWLLKTEPSDYSWADLEEDGSTVWDGVGNNLALKHMRRVSAGDEAFVYHTGNERAVVGIARISSDPYPDPKRDDERLVVFDIELGGKLAEPVTLRAVKADEFFDDFALTRNPRLSVMPVSASQWKRIVKMGGGAG